MDINKIKEEVEEKVEDLKERYGETPIVRYMIYGFLGLVAVLLVGTLVVSCQADANPRSAAQQIILDSGK